MLFELLLFLEELLEELTLLTLSADLSFEKFEFIETDVMGAEVLIAGNEAIGSSVSVLLLLINSPFPESVSPREFISIFLSWLS
jgi:hypothetical protein